MPHPHGSLTSIHPPHSAPSPCSYLHWLSDPPLLHLNKTSHYHLQSCSNSPYKTKSSVQEARQSPVSPLLQKPHSHFLYPYFHLKLNFITKSIYKLKSQGDMIQPCLSQASILKHSLSPASILEHSLSLHFTHTQLIPFKCLLPTSYILSNCHKAAILIIPFSFSDA